jgi:tRNA A-37 threonylcarbamoyl transferase component Bud32/tetratricopeptide (TPR) repeat protein
MGCLDDDTVLRLVEGELAAAGLVDAGADAHLDTCERCRAVVAAVARGRGGLAEGARIGRYVVGEPLGAGAMAQVYAAWEPELDRRVALKVLREPPDADVGDARRRVIAEAQAMARLAHPNVVAVHEVGTVDDAVFVAMELVEGDTLRDWVERPRPWREVAAVLLEVARGLAAVHAAGVVHRDVKPDNVIVGADGRARLGDFGLARAAKTDSETETEADSETDSETETETDSETETETETETESDSHVIAVAARAVPAIGTPTATHVIAGTPAYMAPEVLAGRSADAASDQFCFGVMAWELLHGERPYGGATWSALHRAASAGAPRAPRAAVPRWLDAIVRRCLAPAPAARFTSMSGVAAALSRGLGGRRTGPWIGGGLALAAAASVATWVAVRRAAPAPSPTEADVLRCEVVGYRALSEDAPPEASWWGERWGEVARATCELAWTQPARAAAQDRCLDRRRREVAAVLARPDVVVADALAALPDPGECTALDGGADPVPLDRVRAAAVREVDAGLPAIRAATAAGSAREVVAAATALVERARAADHAPTLADALIALTEVTRGTGDLAAAAIHARDAAAAAERGHADAVAADAWILRLAIAGDRRDLAAADELAVLAEAVIGRAGDAPAKRARLDAMRGLMAYNRGDLDAAGTLLAAAREAHPRGDTVEVARIETALGQVARAAGRLDAAERHLREAHRIDRGIYGERHPMIGLDLHNLAGVLRLRHELDAALATYREALAIADATAGTKSVAAGLSHNSIGLVLMERDEWAAARAELETALAILTARDHADRAIAEHNLGLVAQHAGDHRAAIERFDRAAAIYTATVGATAPAAARLTADRGRSATALQRGGRNRSGPGRKSGSGSAATAERTPDTVSIPGPASTAPPFAAPTATPEAAGVTPVEPPPADVGVYGAAQKW